MRAEVLIVGGGPTGNLLAIALRQKGVGCVLVERDPVGRHRAGGLVLNPLSLQELESAGVLEEARRTGLALNGTRWFSEGAQRYLPFDLAHSGVEIPEVRVVPQDHLCDILRQRAVELGCEIRFGVSFEGFEEHGQGQDLTVTLVSTFGAETTVDCRYLVGCDGPHSRVRQAAGLAFEGQTLDWVYSVAEVTADWDLPANEIFEFLAPEHFLVAIPLPTAGRYRLATWQYRPVSEISSSRQTFGLLDPVPVLDTFQSVAARVAPNLGALSDLSFGGTYRVARRLADRFRSGRVCLAGDAAHLFPPVTGLGMNLGLQDAAALATAIAGGGSYELLEGYAVERRTAALAALRHAELSIVDLATALLHGERGEGAERDLMAERWGVFPHEAA